MLSKFLSMAIGEAHSPRIRWFAVPFVTVRVRMFRGMSIRETRFPRVRWLAIPFVPVRVRMFRMSIGAIHFVFPPLSLLPRFPHFHDSTICDQLRQYHYRSVTPA